MAEKNDFPKLHANNDKTALLTSAGPVTYAALDELVSRFASGLLQGAADLQEERIAFFMPASVEYVTSLLGVWRAGGIAVPLNVASALPELEHALSCATVTRLVTLPEHADYLQDLCKQLNIALQTAEEVTADAPARLPQLTADRRAMILFTSGTTNKPKGVVSTRATITAQITTLIDAWEWQEDDRIPLFLPLHHIHGIINVLCCGLWAGATIDVFPKFDMPAILKRVARGDYTVFMAVPTIYVKIIQHLGELPADERQAICDGFKAMRLNISGSAACPVKVFEQWLELTGQTLLERYGMTEIGMGISNPYNGERRPGAVGIPLPGVEVKLFDEDHNVITSEDMPGEIRIKGRNVFLEYWDNPDATTSSFHDGWFCTGDVAVLENGYYRIMGRSSVDIIKSGGYKLSALEIEGTLLTHEAITECAVIGVEDEMWGEAVTAFVALKGGKELNIEELKSWCDGRMSAYKIPKHLRIVDSLPRNAMGKVTKPALKPLF
ncbi:MAG: acyl-CoA synthetase [Pseudohongiellaceae bacterium]